MTGHNSKTHHRRSIRLPGYDYTSPGAYFVTICVRGGECTLGKVVAGEMQLSTLGRVASYQWQRIPRHFPHVTLDEWVVMPNHLYGILTIVERPHRRGEAAPASASPDENLATGTVLPQGQGSTRAASPLQPGSLGAIVGNFKSVSTRRINSMRHMPGVPFWQRNYWEHIIRYQRSLARTQAYIRDNPARWAEDQLHPDAAPNPFNRW